MLTRQIVPVLTLVMGAGLAFGGCGSSSPSNTGGAGGGAGAGNPDAASGGSGGSTGGSGGATGGAGGSAGTGGSAGATGGAGGTPNFGMCEGSGNTCTKAQIDAHNSCLITKCEAAYKPCIGDGWRTGNFGGMCGTWLTCINKCGCNDNACRQACGIIPPAGCVECFLSAGQCQRSMCPLPACYGPAEPDGGAGIPDGGFNIPDGGFNLPDGGFNIPDLGFGGSCDDLKKCCDMIADASQKSQCNAFAAGGNAIVCGPALAAYKAQNACM